MAFGMTPIHPHHHPSSSSSSTAIPTPPPSASLLNKLSLRPQHYSHVNGGGGSSNGYSQSSSATLGARSAHTSPLHSPLLRPGSPSGASGSSAGIGIGGFGFGGGLGTSGPGMSGRSSRGGSGPTSRAGSPPITLAPLRLPPEMLKKEEESGMGMGVGMRMGQGAEAGGMGDSGERKIPGIKLALDGVDTCSARPRIGIARGLAVDDVEMEMDGIDAAAAAGDGGAAKMSPKIERGRESDDKGDGMQVDDDGSSGGGGEGGGGSAVQVKVNPPATSAASLSIRALVDVKSVDADTPTLPSRFPSTSTSASTASSTPTAAVEPSFSTSPPLRPSPPRIVQPNHSSNLPPSVVMQAS
ncbi:hypothetical protein GYMLUDRAFT_233321 [Collybiopsis luxurians FD-317 M1]|uniref:Uncharacterized protein n=1 Tax=Collybiopsis luxurians FD-317 M1 TaxID=944289 RepID=A0A0D0CCK8_9AGAR|nr:hypothetical protein GYMLUDRAFT_233321 [Collybiopsis luxurians FD-317 M1]